MRRQQQACDDARWKREIGDTEEGAKRRENQAEETMKGPRPQNSYNTHVAAAAAKCREERREE